MPRVALFNGRHARPELHFFKGAAAAFAQSIALAGGANGDARRVWRGVVPGQPRRHRFGRKAFAGCLNLMVIDHQGVHRRQRPQLSAHGDAIRRRTAFAPVVDG